MTNCLPDSSMQAYLEEGGADPWHRIVEGHLAVCSRCRVAFERLAATERRVRAWLLELRCPGDEKHPDSSLALRQVLSRAVLTHGANASHWRGMRPGALATSLMLQSAIVLLLMTVGTMQKPVRENAPVVLLAPSPVVKPAKVRAGGGGGGTAGARPPMLTRIEAPRAIQAFHSFPSISRTAAPSIALPDAPDDSLTGGINSLGDLGLTSGPGRGGIAGDGIGTGPGGNGTEGGEFAGGVLTPSKGVTAPSVLTRVEPEYSEEARKAKYGGSVLLGIVVGVDGRAESIRVLKSLGMGLDDKAIDAVRQWRFRPGTNNGAPVRVSAQVEINFRLL